MLYTIIYTQCDWGNRGFIKGLMSTVSGPTGNCYLSTCYTHIYKTEQTNSVFINAMCLRVEHEAAFHR